MHEVAAAIMWVSAGFWLWSFLEYSLHRFVGHAWHTRLRLRHLEHHRDPLDYQWEPAWTIIGFTLVGKSAEMAGWLCLLSIGMLAGYLCYEWSHWRLHLPEVSSEASAHHQRHHEFPSCNFGVTTNIWDKRFGTLR